MQVNILILVFFSIIICSFEYAENELYFMNERNIYLERNIINLINNRILADADNQFDLYDFYESTLSLANQFSDFDHDEEMIRLRNIIDSHIKKHKENNTLPNLNNADKKTKKLIYELQKELEETKKEIDNIRINELEIQPMQDKRIIINNNNFLEADDDKFRIEYLKNESRDYYSKLKEASKYKTSKSKRNLIIKAMLWTIAFFVIVASGALDFLVLIVPFVPFIFCNWRKINKYRSKL
ncbi:fam-b protein [Plasmodium chabaudi chabaudi]|uniref:Fam-b protein n=1 Tax=Plasmodium chabaudi chabaudi TaxID=31271 RepID=A0A4V0K6J2_PLACU|nr:fam-b protein [Plasmodium chabaudi chabaudi]VTZ68600.1 fam-b protein [Plasmodium chabaudi chabaudi]|eukprot:XP_016652877.1 fam-b protein [Plasmodium chabaudi chabaudi]